MRKVKPRSPRLLSGEWRRIGYALAPQPAEVRKILRALVRRFGEKGTTDLICCPTMTLRAWLAGKGKPTAAARRGIWLTWAVVLHPELIPTTLDIVTWGRFQVEIEKRDEDYSI